MLGLRESVKRHFVEIRTRVENTLEFSERIKRGDLSSMK